MALTQQVKYEAGFASESCCWLSACQVSPTPEPQDNDSDVKYGGKSLSWSRLRLGNGGEAASSGQPRMKPWEGRGRGQ